MLRAMAPRGPRSRADRRARTRTHGKLARDLDRLARLAPGGAPDRPLPIASPAQVEVIAGARPCPLCDGALRVEDHAAETVGGVRLRIARVVCTACGVRRSVYFTLAGHALH
jgi:hypothetical protein